MPHHRYSVLTGFNKHIQEHFLLTAPLIFKVQSFRRKVKFVYIAFVDQAQVLLFTKIL